MNYEQAVEFSLTVPWKLMECFGGEECWCRLIVPLEPIRYTYTFSDGTTKEDVLEQITDAAVLDKITAEHIVKIHNERLIK